MNELLPSLRHWRTHNHEIGYDVDCYWSTSDGVSYVLDPLAANRGSRRFDGDTAPSHIRMTNRLDDRSCDEFARRFGATLWCSRSGLYEYADGSLDATPFDPGELPGAICADELGQSLFISITQ